MLAVAVGYLSCAHSPELIDAQSMAIPAQTLSIPHLDKRASSDCIRYIGSCSSPSSSACRRAAAVDHDAETLVPAGVALPLCCTTCATPACAQRPLQTCAELFLTSWRICVPIKIPSGPRWPTPRYETTQRWGLDDHWIAPRCALRFQFFLKFLPGHHCAVARFGSRLDINVQRRRGEHLNVRPFLEDTHDLMRRDIISTLQVPGFCIFCMCRQKFSPIVSRIRSAPSVKFCSSEIFSLRECTFSEYVPRIPPNFYVLQARASTPESVKRTI